MTDMELDEANGFNGVNGANGINGVNGDSHDDENVHPGAAAAVNGASSENGTAKSKKRLSRLPIPGGMRAQGTRKVSGSAEGVTSPAETLSPKSPGPERVLSPKSPASERVLSPKSPSSEKVLSPKSPRMSMATSQQRSASSSFKRQGFIAKPPVPTAASLASTSRPATNGGIPKPASSGSSIVMPKKRGGGGVRSSLPAMSRNGAPASQASPVSTRTFSSTASSPAGARGGIPRPTVISPKNKSDDDVPKSATLPRASSNFDMSKRRASLALSGLPTLSKKTSAPQLSGPPNQGRRASAYGTSSFGLRTQRSFSSQVSSPATTESGLETPKSATKFRAPASALTSPQATPQSASRLKAPSSALSSPKPALDSPTPGVSAVPKPKPTSKPPSLRLKKPSVRPAFTVSGGPSSEAATPAPKLAPPPADETAAETKKQRSISSSLALREQIAKAKAARRSEAHTAQKISNQTIEVDFGNLDPFNHGIGVAVGPNTGLLTGRIKAARSDGKLNISNMDLKEIPQNVYDMYKMDSADVDLSGNKWYENVDLVKFIGSDNELSEISDQLVEEFGGLQSIDLHNNFISSLPESLTQLTQLAMLNLASNKLTNDALEVIFKIPTIMDLNLSKNQLTGSLSEDISNLMNLESLEIHTNKLDSLPESLKYLPRLKVLNVSVNLLTSIPSLTDCPLVDLNVSSNLLKDSLFSEDVKCMKSLQTLDIKNNSLTCITPLDNMEMPALRQVMASNNQLQHVKSLSGWTELMVFLGESNQLKELPDGTTKLPKLRILDVVSNDISAIPPELGRMESLEVFKFNGNPIRERRLLSLNTTDLKLVLAAKLGPPSHEEEEATEDATIPEPHTQDAQASDSSREPKKEEVSPLKIKSGGVLDLSRRKLQTLDEMILGDLNTALPKILQLYQNSLSEFPPILCDFRGLVTLDISCNVLKGENYLDIELRLPSLTSLLMHNNMVTSLEPITEHLTAPKLTLLDVHVNKLKQIPPGLRTCFPALVSFIAQDNKIEEINVAAIDGLKTLNLSNNEIASLPPRLGLVNGMHDLRLDGNRFRVPKYTLLEKGTEAVLGWLRDRVPPEERDQMMEVEDDEVGGGVPIPDVCVEDEGDESWYDPPN